MKWKHKDFAGNSGKQWSSSIFLHVTSVFYSVFYLAATLKLCCCTKKKNPQKVCGVNLSSVCNCSFFWLHQGQARAVPSAWQLSSSSVAGLPKQSALHIYIFSEQLYTLSDPKFLHYLFCHCIFNLKLSFFRFILFQINESTTHNY